MSFLGARTGKKIPRKKKEMTSVKVKITFLCSDWDTDLKEQDRIT